jgi:hypothetical protein
MMVLLSIVVVVKKIQDRILEPLCPRPELLWPGPRVSSDRKLMRMQSLTHATASRCYLRNMLARLQVVAERLHR